jgi:hypothetical protein
MAKKAAAAAPNDPRKGAAGFGNRLKKMSKMWEEASEASAGGGGVNFNVEDGKHAEARLVHAKLVEVKGGEKLMIEWCFDCTDVGDAAARKADPSFGMVTSRDGLDTPQNLGHLKRKLKYFGFDHTQVKPEELEGALEMITNGRPFCDIQTWISKDEQWQNLRLLGDEPTGWESNPFGEAEVEEEGGDDDLAGLDRNGLKKLIAAEKLEVKVFTKDSDDDIRGKIRAARPEPEVEEEEEVVEEEESVEEEPAEEVVIEKGTHVLYTPPRAKAALTCEVHDGPDEAGTVKLKNLESGKLLAQRVAIDQLQVAASEEEEGAGEEEFGQVGKGSKVQAQLGGKAYKGVVHEEPKADAETLKIKFDEGPHKGKVKDVPLDDCEPLE